MFKIEYSQNFIKSPNLVKKIISLSNISSKDTVYEIGCGKGIITKKLALKSHNVIGFELDKNLFDTLNNNLIEFKNIKIFNKDFLQTQLPTKYSYKIFSNIPFNITTQIINKITNPINCPIDSYLIIQKEAALKYTGIYRSNINYLSLKPFFQFKIIHYFNRYDFTPIPKVDIVLLHIKKLDQPLIEMKFFHNYQVFLKKHFKKYYKVKDVFKYTFTSEQLKRLGRDNNFNKEDNTELLTSSAWINIFNFYKKQKKLR